MWLLAPLAAAAPPDATFDYLLVEDVGGRSGVYVGYRAQLRSEGRYTVSHGDAVHATYAWTFDDSEGKAESGREDRTVRFDPATRRYAEGFDLDDPDLGRKAPQDLAVWFWIDPSTPDGPIRLLDQACTLSRRSGRAHASAGLLVECRGDGYRVDDYGSMRYDARDRYWYDTATGLILELESTEQDTGHLDGESGGFERTTRLVVTTSSYAPAVPFAPPKPDLRVPFALFGLGAGALAGVAGTVLLGLLTVLWVVRPRPPADEVEVPGVGTARIRPLRDALDVAGLDTSACTTRFGPFLEDLGARAVAAGDPAWIAVAGSRLAGFAWQDRAAGVGTVFAPDVGLAANFVARGVGPDFFSETRHLRGPARPAWNVHEQWTVLELLLPGPVPFDPSLVRPYTEADRPAVEALLQVVWKEGLAGWLALQLARGDLAFVAATDGKVVGFALAAVVGSAGRLTLCAVDPAHRDRGIGTELVRARLAALSRVGVEQVLVEVADWNVAMRHVLQSQGFAPVGTMVLQTTQRAQTRRPLVRR